MTLPLENSYTISKEPGRIVFRDKNNKESFIVKAEGILFVKYMLFDSAGNQLGYIKINPGLVNHPLDFYEAGKESPIAKEVSELTWELKIL